MKIIENIQIQNFQSHLNTILDLSPGVNVIIGESTKGKTSIFRAIKLLKDNKPAKPHMWASSKDCITLIRLTDTNKDYFEIKKEVKKGKILSTEFNWKERGKDKTSTGANIPFELSLSDINFQSQFDQFFLIQKTSGEITRLMNNITDSDIADNIRSGLTKDINQLSKQIDIKAENIDNANKELELLPDIAFLEKKEKILGRFINSIEKKQNLRFKLENLSKQIKEKQVLKNSLDKRLETLSEALSLAEHIKILKTQINAKNDAYERLNRYFDLKIEHNNLLLDIDCFAFIISEYEKKYFDMLNLIKNIEKKYKIQAKLIKFKDLNEQKELILNKINKLQEQYIKLISDKGICKYCGNEIENEKALNIL